MEKQIRNFISISQATLNLFLRNKNIFLFFLAIIAGSALYSQGVLPLNNSYLTSGLSPVSELSDYWRDRDGRSYNVPFLDPEKEKLLVNQVFYLDSLHNFSDSLYLYFGGVAGGAEVFLNEKLIGIIETPFTEYLYPIPGTIFIAGRNELKVKLLKASGQREWYPEPSTGILGEVSLMARDEINRVPEFPENVFQSSKVVVYAPWNNEAKFKPDPARFWTDLQDLKEIGVESLWFPFQPHGKYLVMLKKAGFKLVNSLEGAQQLALFNEYPVTILPSNVELTFWKNKNGLRTEAFGKFQELTPSTRIWITEPLRPALIIILVIPLLGILLMKLLVPKTYSLMVEFLTKSKIHIDLIAKRKFLRTPEMVLLNLFRMILVSVMISVPLYYIQCTGNFEWLNIFSTRSLLFKQFSGADLSLAEYFVISFLFVVGINVFKYATTYFLGLIYRMQGFSSDAQNLDVFLYFPLSLGLLLPVAFMFFVGPGQIKWLGVAWALIFVGVSARRLWLSYMGLTTLFNLPASLKILYICAFEILPWIILI